MRAKFIQTCVSSCVLCYVLGVGDRHLENILVTSSGKLLHIDFSYILGDDPKKLEVEMKITQDMLNMLGGKSSNCFQKFKQDCKEAYKKLRHRSSLWYILLTYLSFTVPTIDNFKYTENKIKNHVIERLVPGENDKEASICIMGEKGHLEVGGKSLNEFTSFEIKNFTENLKKYNEKINDLYGNGHKTLYDEIIKKIKSNNNNLTIKFDSIYYLIKILEQIYKSAKTNKVLFFK